MKEFWKHKDISVKIVGVKSYFGGKTRHFDIEYEDGTVETENEKNLVGMYHNGYITFTNARVSDKNNKILMANDVENYTAVDFFDRDLIIGDIVLAAITDSANGGYNPKEYTNLGYGKVVDIVDNNKVLVEVEKLEGPSFNWKNKPLTSTKFTVNSKFVVKYHIV